jgi:hypothetical protein
MDCANSAAKYMELCKISGAPLAQCDANCVQATLFTQCNHNIINFVQQEKSNFICMNEFSGLVNFITNCRGLQYITIFLGFSSDIYSISLYCYLNISLITK